MRQVIPNSVRVCSRGDSVGSLVFTDTGRLLPPPVLIWLPILLPRVLGTCGSPNFLSSLSSAKKEDEMPSKTEVAKVKDLSPAIIDLERLMTRMNEVNVAIGRRAYELFEARGREHGHDLEDWLDAERELVQFFPVTFTDSGESLVVRSEVPGFAGGEIEVAAEPERVFISGRRETQASSQEGTLRKESAQVFRAVDLPVSVDPERATAKLNDGILEITLPKMPPEGDVKKI